MPENNDTKAEAGTAGGEAGSTSSATESGSNNESPAPIFVSFIYDFIKTETLLAGDSGGKPGTLGGPVGGQEPKFKVFTYQYVPMPAPNIENT